MQGTKMQIRTRYNHGAKRYVADLGPIDEKTGKPISKAKQAHKDECDVNFIVRKAAKTGFLPQGRGTPLYGDFSSVPDYQEALSIVHAAEEQFSALPAVARERFGNDPAKFLEFVSDGKNAEEMAKLGLMKPEAVERVASKKAKKNSESADADSKK